MCIITKYDSFSLQCYVLHSNILFRVYFTGNSSGYTYILEYHIRLSSERLKW